MKKGYNNIEQYEAVIRKEYLDKWNHVIEESEYYIDLGKKRKCINEKALEYDYDRIEYAKKKIAKLDRYVAKMIYNYRKPKSKKDNYNLYKGEEVVPEKYHLYIYDSKIRVPKLKRKTAWKRFYKLYPELKGCDMIYGYSSTAGLPEDGQNLGMSIIKLKKI